MSKSINLKYGDEKYTLEYNREAIKIMEKQGFDLNQFVEKPAMMMELAFQGAFIKNHRNLKAIKVEEMYDAIPDKQGLTQNLIIMIQETYDDLFATKESTDGKKASWEIV
jgi:hypothetical protein